MHPSIFPLLEEAGIAVSYQPKINASEVKYKTVDEVYASPTQDIVYQADV